MSMVLIYCGNLPQDLLTVENDPVMERTIGQNFWCSLKQQWIFQDKNRQM
jgi:hypothetical protein